MEGDEAFEGDKRITSFAEASDYGGACGGGSSWRVVREEEEVIDEVSRGRCRRVVGGGTDDSEAESSGGSAPAGWRKEEDCGFDDGDSVLEEPHPLTSWLLWASHGCLFERIVVGLGGWIDG